MLATRLRAAYGVFVRLLTQDYVSEQDWEELEMRIGAVRDDLSLQRREGAQDAHETTNGPSSEAKDRVAVGQQPGMRDTAQPDAVHVRGSGSDGHLHDDQRASGREPRRRLRGR